MRVSASIEAIARRLERTRMALDLSQSEFAEGAGLARNTYNQWEKGKGRPQLDGAIALCNAYQLTLDWIYFGETAGLPYQVAAKLVNAN